MKNIKMTQVESSNIHAIGFDEDNSILYIDFKPMSPYSYTGVDKDVFEEFLAADSKGKFFHQYIKNNYPFKRL
jgi:hypothetical protein